MLRRKRIPRSRGLSSSPTSTSLLPRYECWRSTHELKELSSSTLLGERGCASAWIVREDSHFATNIWESLSVKPSRPRSSQSMGRGLKGFSMKALERLKTAYPDWSFCRIVRLRCSLEALRFN